MPATPEPGGSRRGPPPGGGSSRTPVAGLLAALLGLAAGGPLLAGCAGPEASRPALPDSAYVEVMARLSLIREAGRPVPRSGGPVGASEDSLTRAAIEGVLREAGVAEQEVLDFAREVGDEPERMSALWERIQAVSDSLRVEGWDPPGPLPPIAGPGDA